MGARDTRMTLSKHATVVERARRWRQMSGDWAVERQRERMSAHQASSCKVGVGE